MIDNNELLYKLKEFREFFSQHGGGKFVPYNYITEQYCAIGALQYVLRNKALEGVIFNYEMYQHIYHILEKKCQEEYEDRGYVGKINIIFVNDVHGYSAAMTIIDKVVNEVEERI